MKKLLSILLSSLLLCTMIPFATISAADEYTLELVADAEEVDAGDYVTIEVSMYGHENVGVIAAQIELSYDPDVFELETTYDEDEEAWVAPIEVGPKFNASSNKYIQWPPIDEETGYMKRCLVQFLRGTASASQAVKTNLFYTVTFKVKDDAVSGDYTIDVTNFKNKDIVMHGNLSDEWTWEPITIHVNGSAAACEHEYENECDKNCALCGEETRPEAEHEFFNDCETVCIHCYQEVREASHNVVYAAAKAPTCGELGNIEHWYCDVCGAAWLDADCGKNTNLRAVILPNTGDHAYDDEYDADCNVCGGIREVPEKPVEIAYGDLNGDGAINNRDMALMQQYINKWDVQIDEAAADVNKDGSINNRDLALLQQYINKWDVTLG